MSLFAKEASTIWGEILHKTHTFLQGIEHAAEAGAEAGATKPEPITDGTDPVPVSLPVTATGTGTGIELPPAATTLTLLQAAFGVLGKAIIAAKGAEAARNEGFVNIELDQQEIADIVSLIESIKPIFEILGQFKAGSKTADVSALPMFSTPAPAHS